MTALASLGEAFKREVTIPGTFSTAFPTVTDVELVGSLADAFAAAQLDGFFVSTTLDLEANEVDPDLSLAGGALIVIYAGLRLVRQQLRVTKTMQRYQAGPTEYETQQSAALLTEDLKQLERRRREILEMAARSGRGRGTTFVLDGYLSRAGDAGFFGGFFPHELYSGVYGVG